MYFNTMAGNSESTSESYNHFLELTKPTEEDLKRVFTKEELKELCLKHKCRVDIWRWNVVNDYRILFTQSGRYPKWSDRDRLRMLAKAVNKMKPSVLYNDEEITRTKKKEWKFQLKENILSLNLWKRQRLKLNAALIKSHEIDPELQFEVDTEYLSTEFEVMPTWHDSYIDLQDINMNSGPGIVDELDGKSENKPTTNTQLAPVKFIQNIEVNIIETNFEEDYLTDEDSKDLIETMLKQKQEGKPREVLHSDEVAAEIENIYDINTMSMTIDSEISIPSQDVESFQSQHMIPHNYNNFKSIIPLTSTQSQSQ